jgi:hypothetical protein
MLMQDIGDMRGCWKLNTMACRVAAAIREIPGGGLELVSTDGQLSAFRYGCFRAFILDNALSANMYQPSSLALTGIELPCDILDMNIPRDAMLSVMWSIAQVQEIVVMERRKCASAGQRDRMNTGNLALLKDRMMDIRIQAETVQCLH